MQPADARTTGAGTAEWLSQSQAWLGRRGAAPSV